MTPGKIWRGHCAEELEDMKSITTSLKSPEVGVSSAIFKWRPEVSGGKWHGHQSSSKLMVCNDLHPRFPHEDCHLRPVVLEKHPDSTTTSRYLKPPLSQSMMREIHTNGNFFCGSSQPEEDPAMDFVSWE